MVWPSRFHNYSAELRRQTQCYPVHTSRSIPTDTYSHFNVELLLITISFFHLFTFARLFSLAVLVQYYFTVSSRHYNSFTHAPTVDIFKLRCRRYNLRFCLFIFLFHSFSLVTLHTHLLCQAFVVYSSVSIGLNSILLFHRYWFLCLFV